MLGRVLDLDEFFLFRVSLQALILLVKIDDPNITIEEYIRLEEEKAQRHGKVYNWETATYVALSCEPMVSPLNNNQINFRISFDESDDEDYTVSIQRVLRNGYGVSSFYTTLGPYCSVKTTFGGVFIF
ncbi:hypothetical protein Tco_0594021 [Tanacetum coccineum]